MSKRASTKRAAVIVAGGSGTRMGSNTPKQFLLLAGKPILMHTIERFWSFDASMQIVVVLPLHERNRWKELCQEYNFPIAHTVVNGGSTRFESVQQGLSAIEDAEVVGIHDGVRPLVAKQVIAHCYQVAEEGLAAVPAIAAIDSLREVNGSESKSIDRSKIRLVQTPQVFNTETLKKAYEQPFSPLFTDDASVMEASGNRITLVDGNVENIKITTPLDLIIAEGVLANIPLS